MPRRPTVGKPCGRCGHGQGFHDEEGCAGIGCRCGTFLQADLMVETRAALVISDAVDPYHSKDTHLYAFLRVVEGYSDRQARKLIRGL